ncbi:hypothetical protein [Pseudomonas fluorescens]|uniref:hypothetical protein n=1 Tax=Pseudomonas fluorescens TaxID=294 RepID=UPI001CD1B0D7|nr:hypothetical protein [Pseudomonas fluorescens]
MTKSILICCAALLTGCVGHYQQPASNAPHATLDAKWGKNEFISGGSQAYWAYYDAHCQDTDETGVLGGVSQSEPEKNRFLIQPIRRIYLSALSTGIKERENTDQPLIHRSCLSFSSFVPNAGAIYQVTHSAPKSGCSLEVIDMQTGKAPPTLIVEPIAKGCGL